MKTIFPPYTDLTNSICTFVNQIATTSDAVMKKKKTRTDAHHGGSAGVHHVGKHYCHQCSTVWTYVNPRTGIAVTEPTTKIKFLSDFPRNGLTHEVCPDCNEPVI